MRGQFRAAPPSSTPADAAIVASGGVRGGVAGTSRGPASRGLTARPGFSDLRGSLGATPAGAGFLFFFAGAETGFVFVFAGSWTARGAGVVGGVVVTGEGVEEPTFDRAGAGL